MKRRASFFIVLHTINNTGTIDQMAMIKEIMLNVIIVNPLRCFLIVRNALGRAKYGCIYIYIYIDR